MKCPSCETRCETMNFRGQWLERCPSCEWCEPADEPAPAWCLDRIHRLETQLEHLDPLRPICHRDAGMRATPRRSRGTIELHCAECEQLVAEIAVAVEVTS